MGGQGLLEHVGPASVIPRVCGWRAGDRNRVRTIVSGGDCPVLAWTLSGGGVPDTRTIPAPRGGRLSVTVS
jgi:hypothetical protein